MVKQGVMKDAEWLRGVFRAMLWGGISRNGPRFHVIACDSATARHAAVTGPDAAVTGPDAAVTGPDAAVAGPDAAVTGPDAALAGPDAALAGPDAAATGPDAAMAGPDTAVTAPDAVSTGPDAASAGWRLPTHTRPVGPGWYGVGLWPGFSRCLKMMWPCRGRWGRGWPVGYGVSSRFGRISRISPLIATKRQNSPACCRV